MEIIIIIALVIGVIISLNMLIHDGESTKKNNEPHRWISKSSSDIDKDVDDVFFTLMGLGVFDDDDE